MSNSNMKLKLVLKVIGVKEQYETERENKKTLILDNKFHQRY